MEEGKASDKTHFVVALLAGAAAGTSVDISLFPLDTIKTRMQSECGFWKSGGFRGVYSGLFSAAVGSAPTAALFFVSYESSKKMFNTMINNKKYEPVGHLIAASVGETLACLLRVPVEVVKQRTQSLKSATSIQSFRDTLSSEGLGGFYRGFYSTVIREVPFSALQFSMWEYLKQCTSHYTEKPVTAFQSALCGAISGGIAAGLTTPLDVVKTRIILAEKGSDVAKSNVIFVMQKVKKENGIRGLFAGIGPRVLWISIGGAIFLGVYEQCKISLSSYSNIFSS